MLASQSFVEFSWQAALVWSVGAYAQVSFPRCITVSVECGFILAGSTYFPGADVYLHLFALPAHSHHCFKGSRASQATLLCPCVLEQLPASAVAEGCSAALHVARWAWGAKVGCVLTETWALPRGNGFQHEKELNSHVNSPPISRLCVTTVFSHFFSLSQVSCLLVYSNLVITCWSYSGWAHATCSAQIPGCSLLDR